MTLLEAQALLAERFPPMLTKLLTKPRGPNMAPLPPNTTTLEQIDRYLVEKGAPYRVLRLEGTMIVLRKIEEET